MKIIPSTHFPYTSAIIYGAIKTYLLLISSTSPSRGCVRDIRLCWSASCPIYCQCTNPSIIVRLNDQGASRYVLVKKGVYLSKPSRIPFLWECPPSPGLKSLICILLRWFNKNHLTCLFATYQTPSWEQYIQTMGLWWSNMQSYGNKTSLISDFYYS